MLAEDEEVGERLDVEEYRRGHEGEEVHVWEEEEVDYETGNEVEGCERQRGSSDTHPLQPLICLAIVTKLFEACNSDKSEETNRFTRMFMGVEREENILVIPLVDEKIRKVSKALSSETAVKVREAHGGGLCQPPNCRR